LHSPNSIQFTGCSHSYLEVKSGFGDPINMERMLAKEFKFFDRDESGSIDFDEFNLVLEHLNCKGSARDVDELFDRYDQDCSGAVSYGEFCQILFGKKKGQKPDDGVDPNKTRSVVKMVKDEITKRGGGNGLRSARVLLKRMDKDGNNLLDREELKNGIKELIGIELEGEDIDRLMVNFDKDRSGKISVEEFFKGLQGDMKRKRKVIVRQAYDLLDKDGSGEVTVNDIKGAYNCSEHEKVVSGEWTEYDALQEILATYEQGEADGVVTFQEFLEYYRDLSAGMESDDYFELMVRNAWHISGGKGQAANTSCRRVLVTHTDGSEEIVEIKNDLGIGPKDTDLMISRLKEQGVKNIKKVTP